MTTRRSRFVRFPAALLAAGLALVFAPARPAGQVSDPAALLEAAREAVGGDAMVRAVKALRLTGTTWSSQGVLGGYTRDTEDALEIRVALPDRFQEITATSRGSMILEYRKGFVGERTISTRNGEPTDPPGEAVYVRKKAAELLLILLARTERWGGLTFEPAGPNGIKVRGLDGYAARLEFDPSSHLLSKLVYRQRRQVRTPNTILRRGESRGSPGRSGGGAGGSSGADLPDVEITITFQDRRKVNGVLIPHRITTTAKDIVLWELRFERIAVDPLFTDADFAG